MKNKLGIIFLGVVATALVVYLVKVIRVITEDHPEAYNVVIKDNYFEYACDTLYWYDGKEIDFVEHPAYLYCFTGGRLITVSLPSLEAANHKEMKEFFGDSYYFILTKETCDSITLRYE